MSEREGIHKTKAFNWSHVFASVGLAVAGLGAFYDLRTSLALTNARLEALEKPASVSLIEMDKRVSIIELNMTNYGNTQRKIAADLEVMKNNVTSELGEIKYLLIQGAKSNGPG